MFNLQSILRPNIVRLTPYSCARDEYQGEASAMLDANENSFGSPVSVEGAPDLNRYPASDQKQLRGKVAELKGLQIDQVFLGVGSDEVMDLLVRACCVPGRDSIVIAPPTYGMYQVLGQVNDVTVTEVPLDQNFQLDAKAVLSVIGDSSKLIFFCSPNNP
ncbi:MAG: aminotransferase class I/II-fold pyridoxal phosphate-dependent enzyme, partial [bacterium]|nr:aminotransferase class I/II-fold pyridoxal phosphate-dependent enzyme [bacterium]